MYGMPSMNYFVVYMTLFLFKYFIYLTERIWCLYWGGQGVTQDFTDSVHKGATTEETLLLSSDLAFEHLMF